MSPFLTLKLWSVIPFKIDQTPKVFFTYRPNDLTDPHPGIGSTKKNVKKTNKKKIIGPRLPTRKPKELQEEDQF